MKFTPYARRHQRRRADFDFPTLARTALSDAHIIFGLYLPGGQVRGHEYVAINPRRADNRPGSFRINTRTGRWADFAIGVAGGDLISLVAYLRNISQGEAAREIATLLCIGGPYDAR